MPHGTRSGSRRGGSDAGSARNRAGAGAGGGGGGGLAPGFQILLEDFTRCWDRDEAISVEVFLQGRDPLPDDQMIDLVFQEFCLARAAQLEPDPESYLKRFPAHAEALAGLFAVDAISPLPVLRLWDGDHDALPIVGDTIGKLRLIRELGEGAFARVFLAEEVDLEERLVVVKVSTRATPEHLLLVRARHPNIVEVMSHAPVNDGTLRILCMPFRGGTTLSHVLGERQRRRDRPTSGADLLADLDRVAAPEYPASRVSRPSREVIHELSFPRAAAWLVGQLAEALDHAYSQGVLHGDVKPSNVLLTAEAVPMLLDFNLSVVWEPTLAGLGTRNRAEDQGGTLAYMAPERLRLLIARQEKLAAAEEKQAALRALDEADDAHRAEAEARLAEASARRGAAAQRVDALQLTVADRHRADIYSLGVVLLEILTGRAPELQQHDPDVGLQALASAYFTSRAEGGHVMIRAARGPVPTGLRSILQRCLAPDPNDRYTRASQLAEDLHRWRTDRALVHAQNPFLRTAPFCWFRRQRLAILAALLGATVALGGAAVAWRASETLNQGKSILFYQIAGSWESGAFSYRRQHSKQVKDPGDRALIARRHLIHFHVFGPGDWRQRPEILDLPAFEREELEAWLLEQALRYAHELAKRPDSPDDWQRALALLENLAAPLPGSPIEGQCQILREKLGQAAIATSPPPSPLTPLAPWIQEYLAGARAELSQTGSECGPTPVASTLAPDPREPEALQHYRRVLELRPESFWAAYRAASVAFEVENFDASVGYIRRCVSRCPDNPILRLLLAGCLRARASGLDSPGLALERAESLAEAAAQCDKAQSLDPDFPETYLSRSFLRVELGQSEPSRKDFQHFEALTGLGAPARRKASHPLDLTPGAAHDDAVRDAPGPPPSQTLLTNDSDEGSIRTYFARAYALSDRQDLALEELDRALALDPDRLRARYLRGYLREKGRDDRAIEDFARAIAHPDYETFVASYPDALYALERVAWSDIARGLISDALRLARRSVAFSERYHHREAESHYLLAITLAYAASDDPSLRRESYRELEAAGRNDAKLIQARLGSDSILADIVAEFGPIRPGRKP